MANLEELKKQERTLKKRPRTNIPSYSTEEPRMLVRESTSESEQEKLNPLVSQVEAPEKPAVEIKNEVPKEVIEEKAEKLVDEKVPATPPKPNVPSNTRKKEKLSSDAVVKSVTVRLIDIDDADFLKYACKVHGMNMQEFFWSIMEADIKNTKKINPRDEEHMQFKSIALPEIRTIPIPKSLKDAIGVNAGLHRLPETRYMALVVHKARMADPGWN